MIYTNLYYITGGILEGALGVNLSASNVNNSMSSVEPLGIIGGTKWGKIFSAMGEKKGGGGEGRKRKGV